MTPGTNHALVLTGAPGAATLDAATMETVRLLLTGREVIRERWLAPGDAWEARLIAEPGADVVPLKHRIAEALAALPIDVNLVPDEGEHRRKHLLVADMESTIIEQECLDELADYIGLRPQIAAITERAMRGELEFEAAIKERVGLLKGLHAGVLDDLYTMRVTLMPGAQTLIATMRANGAYCALVSGGFHFFTEKIAARVGFDSEQANRLDIADGRIAGTVARASPAVSPTTTAPRWSAAVTATSKGCPCAIARTSSPAPSSIRVGDPPVLRATATAPVLVRSLARASPRSGHAR